MQGLENKTTQIGKMQRQNQTKLAGMGGEGGIVQSSIMVMSKDWRGGGRETGDRRRQKESGMGIVGGRCQWFSGQAGRGDVLGSGRADGGCVRVREG